MPLVSRIPEINRQVEEFATQLVMAMGRDAYIEALAQVPIQTAALRDSMTVEIREEVGATTAEVRTHGSQAEHLARMNRTMHEADYSYATFVRDRLRFWLGAMGAAAVLEDHQGFMEWAALETWDKLDVLVGTYATRTGLR